MKTPPLIKPPEYTWRFSIKGIVTPSGNEYTRWHYHKRAELKKRWLVEILATNATIPKATGKRFIKVTRVSKRWLDSPNLYLPIDKLIIDHMRKEIRKQVGRKRLPFPGLGWIVDDSPKYMEMFCTQEKGEPEMIIEMCDWPKEGLIIKL